MILWYYQIRPNVVWKVHGAWIDGDNLRTKTKTLPLPNKSLLFFSEQCIIAKHVISHPVIAAILDVILKNLQR